MPQRTNEYQSIIGMLRRVLAGEGCDVQESVLLRDRNTGGEAEVDVVMTCAEGDVEAVFSFEVVAWRRKAGRPWVEQQIRKHRDLPTSVLILVSWSGFTKDAHRLASVEANLHLVTLLEERTDGGVVAKSLFMEEVAATPRDVSVIVRRPDGTQSKVSALQDNIIYSLEGVPLGHANALIAQLLLQPSIGRRMLADAHAHPEPEALHSFRLELEQEPVGMALQWEATKELHGITKFVVAGDFQFRREQLVLSVRRFKDQLFGFQRSMMLGREAALVASLMPDLSVRKALLRLDSDDELLREL